MKRILLLIVALTAMSVSAQLPKVYDETIDPMEQIDKALAQAGSEKYVICQVGGNWCPWCLKFAKFITDDEEIANVINDNYVYIHVNYNTDGEGTSDELKKRLGYPRRFGFPVFVVLDPADGGIVHIQDSSFLEEGKSYNKDATLRFLRNWTPKAVNSKQ